MYLIIKQYLIHTFNDLSSCSQCLLSLEFYISYVILCLINCIYSLYVEENSYEFWDFAMNNIAKNTITIKKIILQKGNLAKRSIIHKIA